MKNLAHSASFESLDKNAPSNTGTKQLGLEPSRSAHGPTRADALACADAEGAWREWQAPRHHPMVKVERAYLMSDRSCAAQKPLGLHGLGCAGRPSWAGMRDLRWRQLQPTRPTLEFRPRSGTSVHVPGQRQQIESETAAASRRGWGSVHLM